MKSFFDEPRSRKRDCGKFESHDHAAGVIYVSVPEKEIDKAERTDEKIRESAENVRPARDRVRIEQGGFSVHDVE